MKPKYEINKNPNLNLLKVGELGFFHNDKQIVVEEAHYYPIFIAKNVDELRGRPDTQKILRKFKIFGTEEDNIKDEQEEIRKKEEEA
jgi:hypothetical protein